MSFLIKSLFGSIDQISCINVILTLSPMTNFRLFQTVDNFKFNESGRKFFKRMKNTEGKGEIARYEQFLLFPQCFQKTLYYCIRVKSRACLGMG